MTHLPDSGWRRAEGMDRLMEALGAVVGLLAVHASGASSIAGIARAVASAALLAVIAACIVLLFPETRAQELDAP